MADEKIMKPVPGTDPCGEDMRWDMDFMTVMQDFETLFLQDQESVVAGAAAAGGADAPDARDYISRVERLCGRTKDLGLLGVRAEAMWRSEGLAAFAGALEDMVAAAEQWPDPESGIHPRADEYDGDLGERVAPVTRLLNAIPALARSVGWGPRESAPEQRQAARGAFEGVFNSWTARLEPALGDELPSRLDAWNAIRALLPGAEPAAGGEGGEAGAEAAGAAAAAMAPPPADAWELVERAGGLMADQDRHSPALPLLELLLMWRSKGILEIAEGMKTSGVTMEQLLDSVRKQLASK